MTELTGSLNRTTRLLPQPWLMWLRTHRWLVAILAFAALRITVDALFVVGIPRLESHSGFYFHHGGDQDYYFEYAQALASGPLRYFAINMGTPAVMALFIKMTAATSYDGILTPMVLLNGFVLGSVSVVLIGLLARRIFASPGLGLLAAGIWAVAPWLLYAIFGLHPRAAWVRAPYVPALAWLNVNSDGPAIFFLLLGSLLLWKAASESRVRSRLLAGLMFGLAALFRIHMALPVAVVFVFVVLGHRRWRLAPASIVGGIVGYMPQVIYNRLASLAIGQAYINPFLPGYLYFGYIGSGGIGRVDPNTYDAWKPVALVHFATSLQRYLASRVPWAAAGAILVLLALAPFVQLWRARGAAAALFTFLTGPIVIGFAAASAAFVDDPFRFSMPAFPFLLLAAVWTIGWAWSLLTKARE